MDGTTEAVEWAHQLSLSVHRMTKKWLKADGADVAQDIRTSVRWVPVDLLDAEALSKGSQFGTSASALQSLDSASCALGRALYLLRLSADLGYSRPADCAPLSVAIEELSAFITRWRAELLERLDRIETPALN